MSAHAQMPDFAVAAPDGLGFDARRSFDGLVALVVLILLAPVLAAIAIAIWIESDGPIFFSQVRLGRGGTAFSAAQVPQVP